MKDFEIVMNGNVAEVYTPYNAEFVSKIKTTIGGRKWNSTKKCWTVPETAVNQVRELMYQCYGRTDVDEGETVKIRVTVTNEIKNYGAPITIFGKTIAKAYSRDSGARVGDDVVFCVGAPTSGGSRNYWCTQIDEGCVFEVNDVNVNMITDLDFCTVEIL